MRRDNKRRDGQFDFNLLSNGETKQTNSHVFPTCLVQSSSRLPYKQMKRGNVAPQYHISVVITNIPLSLFEPWYSQESQDPGSMQIYHFGFNPTVRTLLPCSTPPCAATDKYLGHRDWLRWGLKDLLHVCRLNVVAVDPGRRRPRFFPSLALGFMHNRRLFMKGS